jgi:hypothetical protein
MMRFLQSKSSGFRAACACLLLVLVMTGNRTMAEQQMDELKKRTPMDLSFKQIWKRRFVFDAEIPFPKDVSFLPCGHYAADVTSLPAEMQLVAKNGDVKMSVEAPSDVTPPYTFHVAFCGKSRCGVYVTKDGVTKLSKLAPLPDGFDPRDKMWTTELSMRGHGGMGDVKKTLTAGMGQADVRFVTRGRQNALYWEDGRLFFTFSVRIFGGFQGVASFDPAKMDVRLEGTILFDYGDGKLRNDVASHLFFDEEAGEWRAFVSNFSTGGDGLNGRAEGGLNAAWCKENPLHGLSVMKAKSLGLKGLMHEDPSGIWDPEAKKWRLFLCTFVKGIKAQMLESDHWDGPYEPLTEIVPEDSTGTTIQWMNGIRYCFSGSAEHALYVYSYPMLQKLGKLKLDVEPWGDTPLDTPWGVMKTTNSRVWPCFAELPDGYPYKYILLTMDRINIPGMPNPNWTYGGLYIYGAN